MHLIHIRTTNDRQHKDDVYASKRCPLRHVKTVFTMRKHHLYERQPYALTFSMPLMRLATLLLALSIQCLAMGKGYDKTDKVEYPGGRSYMFRVMLKDKRGTPFTISHPESYLSRTAIARRQRQGLTIDSTDLPVSPAYIQAVKAAGVDVVSRSRWNNTLLVRGKDISKMMSLRSLPFVIGVKRVWTSPDSITSSGKRAAWHSDFYSWDTMPDDYGVCAEQIKSLKGDSLHSLGWKGNGKTIAVLDGGFMNVDKIPAFKKVRIIGTHDFVVPPSKDVFKEIDHGTMVLSAMAINEPNIYVGTAPEAAYWLLRCEDTRSESEAEEDYWAAAAEFADSVGVDVINSSLGFHAFDDKSTSHKYGELDGKTALISRTASMLARKGIVLVNSAGNEGMGTWKKINFPADASDILTVGSISPEGMNAAFSSVGPTADGRVKPDVMAYGSPTAVITGRGTIIRDMGTSFSAPLVSGLVACLWEALPKLTATLIEDIVRRSANNYPTPDNIFGYGVPDFMKAYQLGKDMTR